MALNTIHFDMGAVASGSAATITKGVNGTLKKIVIKRDTNNFTLDVDLANAKGIAEPIIETLTVSADSVLYPRTSASDIAGVEQSNPVEFILNGEVSVAIPSGTNGDEHDVYVIVENSK